MASSSSMRLSLNRCTQLNKLQIVSASRRKLLVAPPRRFASTSSSNTTGGGKYYGNSSSQRSKTMRVTLAVGAVIAVITIASSSKKIYSFLTSYTAFPPPIRKHLRSALLAQHDNDPEKASAEFGRAFDMAVELNEQGKLSSDHVAALNMCTGIAAQWGSVWETTAGGRTKAVEAYRKGYQLVMRFLQRHDSSLTAAQNEIVVTRGASLATKIGDLYVDERLDDKAEPYYVWSIEQLMKLSLTDQQKEAVRQEMETGQPAVATQPDQQEQGVPAWLRSAELVSGFERLGELYIRQRKVDLAQPLLQQAVVALYPPPPKDGSKRKPPPPIQNRCHAATVMNNLSSSYVLDASPSAEAIDAASRWARQALTVANACRKEAEKKRNATSSQSTEFSQREDRECELVAVVGAYNLGKLAELAKDERSAKGWFEKSKTHASKLGLFAAVQQATEALEKLAANSSSKKE